MATFTTAPKDLRSFQPEPIEFTTLFAPSLHGLFQVQGVWGKEEYDLRDCEAGGPYTTIDM